MTRTAASSVPAETAVGGAWPGAYSKYTRSGNAAAAEIEASETYLQKTSTSKKRTTAAADGLPADGQKNAERGGHSLCRP